MPEDRLPRGLARCLELTSRATPPKWLNVGMGGGATGLRGSWGVEFAALILACKTLGLNISGAQIPSAHILSAHIPWAKNPSLGLSSPAPDAG
jgi:hypothetical protein